MKAALFSAFLSDLPLDINTRRTIQLETALTNLQIPFELCEGVYKGTKEISFKADLSGYDNDALVYVLRDIKRLAFNEFKQESILLINAKVDKYGNIKNECNLLFNDKTMQYLGLWTEVDSFTAIQGFDAYTIDSKGDYYAAI